MEGVISDFNGSNTIDLAMTIYTLESCEVHLLLIQDQIVAQLIARLLPVELIFEHVNLVVQLL